MEPKIKLVIIRDNLIGDRIRITGSEIEKLTGMEQVLIGVQRKLDLNNIDIETAGETIFNHKVDYQTFILQEEK